ncbi:MAG: TonB family protein [Thiobacillus sp.]
MKVRLTPTQKTRMAGFFVVLVFHGALLSSLWHYKVLPPPAEAATLFVNFIQTQPPKPEPPKPKPPEPPKPVKLEQPKSPEPHRHLVVEAPAAPTDYVMPPPLPPTPKPEPVVEAPPAPPPPSPKSAGPIHLSGDLSVACPTRTPPAYPALSRRLGEEGKVVLRVELETDGRVDSARVSASSGFKRLDEAALAAVRSWRCNPPMRDGQAVRAVATQPFQFNLE